MEVLLDSLQHLQHRHFINIALSFLEKAFFAEGLAWGFEQLLWHIVSIDALLGPERGNKKNFSERVARLIGDDDEDEERISSDTGKLYDFRSKFVHGEQSEKDVFLGHLTSARTTARECLVTFLRRLSREIQSGNVKSDATRETILDVVLKPPP